MSCAVSRRRRPSALRKRSAGEASFSLIEVAIALGIAVFAVVPLIGLLSVGLNSSKSSEQDTVLALAARTVVSDLRSTTYSSLIGLSATNFFFDQFGISTNASRRTAYYKCAVKVVGPANAASSLGASFATNTAGVILTFTWPGQTNTIGANAETFFTAISKH